MINKHFNYAYAMAFLLVVFTSVSCSRKTDKQGDEQISASTTDEVNDSLLNSVTGNATMKQISTFPNRIILTGLDNQRLVSIYKSKPVVTPTENMDNSRFSYDHDESGSEFTEHFMPGIDILFGYNLLNIVHYDLNTEKVHFLFNHPVLVKTLYYPSFIPDSVNKQAVVRNYYMVSVYDEDTNKDTLINKKDLRRFYHFDESGMQRTQIIPPDYSVIRSQYDPRNDLMYIFARHDENSNGTQEKSEPMHIFWFSLKTPGKAKLLY